MKVKEKTELINGLHHGLDFATDTQVNNHLINAFWNYDYLFEDDEDQTRCFVAVIDRYSVIFNKLKDLDDIEYEPLWNIDYEEDVTVDRIDALKDSSEGHQLPNQWKTTQNNGAVTSTTSDSGYNSSTMTPTSSNSVGEHTDETTQSGDYKTTGVVDHTGRQDVDTHTKKTGNYGMTSSQDLYNQEADKLMKYGNLLDLYVDEFKNCFNIRLDWLF